MIKLENICKSYRIGTETLSILSGLALFVGAQEFVSIMGPSGSGKSTLLSILGCLDTPDSGSYVLDSQEVTKLNEAELATVRNKTIGFVFQSFHLISHYSALQNVALPLVYAGVDEALRRQKSIEVLTEVGLSHRMHHVSNELSGGERQRVAIARALVTNPAVILADEPTGNLDSSTGDTILHLLKTIHQTGKTVIVVTHDERVAQQTQRIIRVKDGRVSDAV